MTGLNLLEKETSMKSEREKAIISLVDYIRNQQLSFFDEAAAIHNLIEHYGLTQEEAAAKLGRVQSTIANKLRLLRLTVDERKTIIKYNLTERHARALLRIASSEDRKKMLDKIVDEKLNVDKTEQLIDAFIGNPTYIPAYKKRASIFQSVTALINSINKAVDNVKSTGLQVEFFEIQKKECIEYTIIIPVTK
ncbi:MAG: chromosome partitioning protein ParB [Ruminococcus sp.]|nr:chromosome partitioning protein ParB [Ruminococcus sp.]